MTFKFKFFVCVFFRENKAWHFIWIVCLALNAVLFFPKYKVGNSHEMPNLIILNNNKKKFRTGLPLIFYFKIPWLFPDFSPTFHHFPEIFDGLPAPLTAVLSHQIFQQRTYFQRKNNILTKEWGQFCKFMFLKIKESATAISVLRKFWNSLTFPWLLSVVFQFPWLKLKFPDFSLTWKKIHFPDFFPWLWQPCRMFSTAILLSILRVK